jgi:hypothetical protein
LPQIGALRIGGRFILKIILRENARWVDMIAKLPSSAYLWLLPLLHLISCATIVLAKLDSGWHYMIYVDFPCSLLLVILSWRNDNFLFWFATLGTLWWYLLGRLAHSMLSKWKSN